MKIHIVQKGDTLWEIAKKYHVDFEELKELNSHLASPDMIMPGMKIRIPTHSKKVTQGDKAKTLPKTQPKQAPAPKKEAPAPKKEVQKEKPALELPKMPTFPFEPEEILPTLEEKEKTYPAEVLPEIPKVTKKKEAPKVKEQIKPKAQPKPKKEVLPETAPMQPEMMQPKELPCCGQPQMMPMFTYPCAGYMPMQHMAGGCGCGCSGGHGFPPFHYGMQAPMQPHAFPGMMPMHMQPQTFPGMMQQQFQAPQENMYQPVQEPMMQMYPEPTLALRNEEQELYPTPAEDKTDSESIGEEE